MSAHAEQNFGERIRQLRRERGWSQLDLAEATGLSKTFLCDVENGHKEPCLGTIRMLARGLGITLGELFATL